MYDNAADGKPDRIVRRVRIDHLKSAEEDRGHGGGGDSKQIALTGSPFLPEIRVKREPRHQNIGDKLHVKHDRALRRRGIHAGFVHIKHETAGKIAEKHPDLCRLTDDTEDGGLSFEIAKGRFCFRLTEPYSDKRRAAASEYAKKQNNPLRNRKF